MTEASSRAGTWSTPVPGAHPTSPDPEGGAGRLVTTGISALAAENAGLHEQALLRQRWLEAASEIQAELLAGATEQEVLRLIAHRVTELASAQVTLIVLGSDDVDEHVTVSGRRRVDEERVLHSLRRSAPLLREVLTGRTAVLACTADDLLEGAEPATPGTAAPPGTSASGEAYGSLIAVPLGSAQCVPGVLVTLREMGAATFEPAQVLLLASFADQAALALQLGERNRALRWLDVLAERERIARELHDTVMQRLFATGLQLQSIVRRIPEPAVQELVRPSVDALDQIVRDIRRVVFERGASDEGEPGLPHRLPDISVAGVAE